MVSVLRPEPRPRFRRRAVSGGTTQASSARGTAMTATVRAAAPGRVFLDRDPADDDGEPERFNATGDLSSLKRAAPERSARDRDGDSGVGGDPRASAHRARGRAPSIAAGSSRRPRRTRPLRWSGTIGAQAGVAREDRGAVGPACAGSAPRSEGAYVPRARGAGAAAARVAPQCG